MVVGWLPLPKKSKICLTVNYSKNKLTQCPPCGSVVVDDEGEGWGRLFGWKTSNKTSILYLTSVPPPPKNSEICITVNYSIINLIWRPPCGSVVVDDKGEGWGRLFGWKTSKNINFNLTLVPPAPPKNSEICLTVKYSKINLIWRPPCGSVVVDDEGDGLGRLFGQKNNNKTSISCLTFRLQWWHIFCAKFLFFSP